MVDTLIRDYRHITTSELCAAIGTRKPGVMVITRKLGYRKACTSWLTKMLTVKQKKTVYMKTCAEVLLRSEKDFDAFLSGMITGDEIWVHHYDPLTKRQSVEWHHHSSASRKKSKVLTYAGNVTASIFWDNERIL
jgi:hypothetical protein